jgi:hypothetical protein
MLFYQSCIGTANIVLSVTRWSRSKDQLEASIYTQKFHTRTIGISWIVSPP